MKPLPLLLLVLSLAGGCGNNAVRYVAMPGTDAAAPVALRLGSLEVRDVVLPDYAEAPEILVEQADGGLARVKGAIWGDGSARAVTAALATSLAARSTAAVAAEPWPLSESPDARLHVRVHRMVASADGAFTMAGQFAVESPTGRESIRPFSVSVPLPEAGAGGIARAKGTAIDQLADLVIAALRR